MGIRIDLKTTNTHKHTQLNFVPVSETPSLVRLFDSFDEEKKGFLVIISILYWNANANASTLKPSNEFTSTDATRPNDSRSASERGYVDLCECVCVALESRNNVKQHENYM